MRRLSFSLLFFSMVRGCTVWVDFNTYNTSTLAQAQTSPAFLSAHGQWTIVDNSPGVSPQSWRAALAAVGAGLSIAESFPELPSKLNNDTNCALLPSLVPIQRLSATFQYHEYTAATMLSNEEIEAGSLACGGIPVVGLTRDYTPGSIWRNRVQEALGNALLKGVVMEFYPDDWGQRHEDDFVKELLASNKWPMFLLPFRTPNPKNLTTEGQIQGLMGYLASRGVNLMDDRLVFVVSNYNTPMDVLGPTNSIESALRAAMGVCNKPAPTAATVLYSQPDALDVTNASLVRVSPSAPAPPDTAVVTFWRLGSGPLRNVSEAVNGWEVGDFTGGRKGAPAVSLTPAMEGASAVSYANGTFGALLNLFVNPVTSGQTLGTITMEYNWGAGNKVAPWAGPGGASATLDLSCQYEVPEAYKTGVAVYSSWSLGLHSATAAGGAFIWYETAIFDLARELGGDTIMRDTISGDIIVHGVLGAPSKFHTAAFDTANASSSVWPGKRLLHFSVSGNQVRAAVAAANAAYNLTLQEDPASWSLVHTNIELEGTGDATGTEASRAGHSLSAMRVMLVTP